jgi:hypothetical protein
MRNAALLLLRAARLCNPAASALLALLLAACERRPELHLYDQLSPVIDIPIVDLDLEVYWDYDYEIAFGIDYDWQAEWYYGWDAEDIRLFGQIGYTLPSVFNIRRYFTGQTPYVPHTSVLASTINDTHFQASYEWGFWDILVWNQVYTIDGVQSLIFDEKVTLDSVFAYTNASMQPSRYQAPRYTHSFYAPEPLFSAYDQAIEINRDLEGFVYDPERNVYVKTLDMTLVPITYIYLTQVILHHNNGRITSTDGIANLSGMARSTNLNTGRAGLDAITVNYNTRMKFGCDQNGENVDIVGGRLLTFGIPGSCANNITRASELKDSVRHYMDVTMQFNNGMDSTFVFDVTRQVREHYKGGVITVELDLDTVPIPRRSGGSGFNAVVKDFEDGGTHEFEM